MQTLSLQLSQASTIMPPRLLQVTMEAGPAALLAVAEPQPLRTSLRAVLPLLRVHSTDAHGNAAACTSCEARSLPCASL